MSSDLPPGWKLARLGDVLTLKRGYDLPASKREAGDVPIVSSSGISGTHSTAKVAGPGVVTGRYGTIGRVFFIDEDFWPLNTALYVADFRDNDPRYCAELLKTINYRAYDGKSGVPGINRNDLHEVHVPLARPEEQRRIAVVLGALDDKIECNRRLAESLSEVISEQFRHQCSAPCDLDATLVNLATVARFVNGRAFTKDATGSGRPIIRIKELNDGMSHATPLAELDAADENVARHHDLLFSWSGSLDVYRWHGPVSLINQHIFKVLPNNGLPTWFVEGWIREHLPEFRAIARDKATTMGHIKREHLRAAEVRLPPPGKLRELDAVLSPLDAHVGALAAETRTLTEVRDALLPKLVSGQIRVPAEDADPVTLVA